nr:hypothetical protein [Rhodococcus sp. 06-418-1B]
MTVEEGALVLGKIVIKTRTNKRFEPLFVREDNAWEAADPETFKASSPLKVPNDVNVENSGFVIAELVNMTSLPGKDEKIFKLGPVRPADVIFTPDDLRTTRSIVERIDEFTVPRWAGTATDIFVKSEGNFILGPFRMTRKKLRAPVPAKLEKRSATEIITASIDGYLVGDRIHRLPVVGYYDSRSVDEIVNSVADLAVSTLSHLDFDEADVQTAKATLHRIGDWLADRTEDIGSIDSEKIQRTLAAFEDAATARRLAKDVATKLGGIPDVVRLMDQAIEEGRANADRGEQLRIEQQVKQENERLGSLARQKAAVQRDLERLRTQIEGAQLDFENARKAAKARSEEVRADVAVAVQEIIDGSRERLASAIIGQALVSQAPPQSAQSELAQLHEPDIRAVSPTVLTTGPAINKRISALTDLYGSQPVALQQIISAFRAGLIPVTLGNGGPASINAAADIAYSGRLARMSIAHDFLHPADLLGLHSGKPGTARHHHKLLPLASAAAATGEVVIMLEGINQAPTESYLVPWLQDRWNLTELEGLDYSRNLRIAGTIATGVTSARVSPDLWGYAVAIETPTLPHWVSSREYSQIEVPEPEQPTSNVTEDLLDGVESQWPITGDILQAGDRYGHALSVFQNEDQVRRSVALCLLLPAAATSLSDTEYDEFVEGVAEKLSMSEEKALLYSGLARRLRMRFAR